MKFDTIMQKLVALEQWGGKLAILYIETNLWVT
jgi:hypothetical protein